MGRLYLVATPIGNLGDITFRAVEILKEVPLIAAEDTRTSAVLLKHYGISTPLTSFHDHSSKKKLLSLAGKLEAGDLAVISDAGTPGINDPGFRLVQAAINAGHQVIPIPGPSSPIAALTASGLPSDQFLYLGYLPRKIKARVKTLQEVKELPWTLICLEVPHRLEASLQDCLAVLGDRPIAVARELTKLHEQILRGPLSRVLNQIHLSPLKGELTLVISPPASAEPWPAERLRMVIQERIRESGLAPSRLARQIARESSWPRREVYDLIQSLNDQNQPD